MYECGTMERMIMPRILLIVLAAASAAMARTATTTSRPATQPADDPQALPLLEKLEAAREAYPAMQASIVYTVKDYRLGDSERRTGTMKLQWGREKTSDRFYIGFDTLRQGEGRPIAAKLEYAFDGKWLTEAKHRIKQMTRYQVVAEGRKAEPLRVGRGPFPMPVGQKAADVLKYFRAFTREPREEDPPGTAYLRLMRRPEHADRISAVRVEIWLDTKTGLPVRLVSRDAKRNVTTVEFSEHNTKAEFDEKTFHLPRPIGWKYSIQPLTSDRKPSDSAEK